MLFHQQTIITVAVTWYAELRTLASSRRHFPEWEMESSVHMVGPGMGGSGF